MTDGTVALAGEARSADKLAQWVQRRESVIAHDATNSIWHQVPAYGDRADAGLRDEVEAHCRQVFAAFLASVTERRHPLRSDFPWSGQHAMRRVELGITLSDFMKAFRVGQLTLWDDILAGVNEWPSTKDAALLLVSQVMRTIEVGSTAAAEAYLEAQQYQLADSARLARDLLEDLLAGKPPTVEERQLALAQMGLADDGPLVALVATLPSKLVGAEQRARLRAALTVAGRGMVVARHHEVVALLPVGASGPARVVDGVRTAVVSLLADGILTSVGLSCVRTGFHEIPWAYEDARTAMDSLLGRPGVRAMDEMSTLDLLISSQKNARLVPPEVRAFVEEDLATGGILVETLSTYVSHDLNAKLTAMHLHVHANTIYYRLDRIAERTGCDVRRVEDLIDLLLAVRLIRAEAR
ncbi:PucR family transcriptional regulator [Nocardioides ganghwensis]|jgi:DNA-binding PucR family transcriptional regulator|uniref:PucR family transcriptional regulator n=1 Tax=Nocardioides ganghwensis TaxID=252230 RepID=A0A4Q2SCD4_9ACTN|nr:helix-turn-helix domain-containing protein [Nocardioides ganghwensis]MBD3947009.1 helix-turn-helix domain-containing protein [Nocardioides ganghwensis]RYC01925.1 PucR family transcriptional regulator [Nocardioides ganghwensis]